VSTEAAKATTPGPSPVALRRYPVSCWYICPAAAQVAGVLAATRLRPGHVTACGLASAGVAVGLLLVCPQATPAAAALVLAAWFFDRLDGPLARQQQTASAWGAWLDGNVDELVDLGLHVAVAAAAAARLEASWPWLLLVAFLMGKYLFMYGLVMEQQAAKPERGERAEHGEPIGWLRWAYHLPGNADVRVHLLIVALAGGWLVAELALVAGYYNLRWIVRYGLVARRLGGAQ